MICVVRCFENGGFPPFFVLFWVLAVRGNGRNRAVLLGWGGFVLSLCCGDTNNCCNVCGAYRANYKKFAVAVIIAR